ncbi:MAG: hypothetical protein CL609_15025 [Anaerolineaceae bacterium]|nr:hypothetical protein [Anaerolineaceae bacterium]
MDLTINIETNVIGKNQQHERCWEMIIVNPEIILTLKDLVTELVREEVNTWNLSNQKRRLYPVLSFEEFENGYLAGKFDFKEKRKDIEPEKEVIKAIEAFENGSYYVFVNGEQIKALNDEIIMNPNCHIVFIRVIPLVGG